MITRVFPFMRGPAHLRVVPREADINELLRGDKSGQALPRRVPAEVDAFVRNALTMNWDEVVSHVEKNQDQALAALKELGHVDSSLGLELDRMKEEIESPETPWVNEADKLYRTDQDFDSRQGDIDWRKVRALMPANFNGWVDALEKSTKRTLAESPNLPFDIGFDWTRWYSDQWNRWRSFSGEVSQVSDQLDGAVQELQDFERDLPYLRIDDLQQLYPDIAAEALANAEAREWMVEEDSFYFNDKLADEEQASRVQALESWGTNFRNEEAQYLDDLLNGKDPKPLTQWSFIDLLNITGTNTIDKTPVVVHDPHHH